MLVNFEVGALEKWIKLKGTDGPLVSHHAVFRPRAPAVAAGPPPPPIPTVPPCPTPPCAPPAAAHRSDRAHGFLCASHVTGLIRSRPWSEKFPMTYPPLRSLTLTHFSALLVVAAADASDRHTRVPELPLRVLPSSLPAWTSSLSDAAPNRGPECHAKSPSCRACGLLHRDSASTPTARLRPAPPLLRPPRAPRRSRAPL
jgi:hypothetical protein